ncbi:MAG TPA: ABC-2 family transporter protein [Gemmataceae bacterium]|jgi:ABC-2 type transport system permease protein|nr:ABC-2 family transporter protein [Gemmataceae bacterium]
MAKLVDVGGAGLPALGPASGALRKYIRIFRVALIERMAYRSDFFLSTFLRFLPMLTTILLWQAVYTGAGADELAGYTLHQMIAYLLLVHISRMFSSMPGLAHSIARDIRDGGLKKYLLQPIDMIAYLVSYRVAHKTAYIVTSALPYAVLFFLCRSFFDRFPDGPTLAAYVLSLLLAFLIGFFFEASIGMIGFWFLEVSSLLYIINTVNFFISGQMLPLDLLPPFWVSLLKALPFQYLAYFPAAVFVGKVQGEELVRGLVAEAAWAAAFIVLARVLYRVGLRRYSAYGG